MVYRLQGRVALVTGAGQGIGAAIVRRFIQEGAQVVGLDRKAEALEALAFELTQFTAFPADVKDHDALARCVESTLARHNRLDILINNAAIMPTLPMKETSTMIWREVQAINLEAQFVLAKLVARPMAHAGYGRIVNVSSTEAIRVEAGLAAYAASKGGIIAFSQSLAVELARDGILVNVLAPGCIHTSMSVVNGIDETTTDTFQEWYVRRRKIPLARPGQPDEVAAAALFLASEECSYLTGHTLVIDGGLTITF
jgi:NAD(P)-dependent dehydrogenase (short-subunit alcohol dehydrogenase family)